MADSTTLVTLVALALVLLAAGLLVYKNQSRKRAERRADTVVRELLTPGEVDLLEKRGYLDVPSRTTPGRVYRIPARPGLVTVMDAGELAVRLCLMPARTIPEREWILVHKLLLEGAEAEYWQRANRLMGHWWPAPDASQVELWTGPPPGVMGRR
jgi:hypothetical protein